VLLGINIVLVLPIVRKPSWLVFLATLVSSLVIAAALPLFLGTHPFRIMRFTCWGWLLHAPLVCIACGAIASRKGNRPLAGCALVLGLIGMGIAVDAVFVEPRWLEVTELQIVSDRVRRPITFAIVADLQTDHIGEYERDVFDRIRRRAPDMVLFAGDYLQIHDELRPNEANKLKKLTTELAKVIPGGLFAVGGNVDSDWTSLFPDENVQLSPQTSTVETSQLSITGLSIPDSFDPNLIVDRPNDRFHIVLGHSPDFSLGQVDADLLVAGHTHGGQVCLPFYGPVLTLSKVPRSWCSGLTQIAPKKNLIVSRGIGMERRDAPRVRFRCRPQLIFVKVYPAR
jgi:predicted MPP superfamily phosphohydrolase